MKLPRESVLIIELSKMSAERIRVHQLTVLVCEHIIVHRKAALPCLIHFVVAVTAKKDDIISELKTRK